MISTESLPSIEETPESDLCELCEVYKVEKLKIQQDMNKLIKDAKMAADSFTAENEKNKMLMKKFKNLYEESRKETDTFKLRFDEEKKKNGELAEKIKNFAIQIEENSQKAKMREEFLESIINDREKEYKKLNFEKSRIHSNSKNENERVISLTPNTENLSNNSSQIGLVKKNSSQAKLQTRRKILSEINNPSNSSETCVILKEYLKKTNRVGLFQRDQGNLFRFGKKKVYITVKHGNILCRVGGGFENIEDFIAKNQENKHSISPIEKAHRRHKTIDDVQQKQEDFDLINSMYCRSSPEIEKLIRLKLRSSSGCNTNCITE